MCSGDGCSTCRRPMCAMCRKNLLHNLLHWRGIASRNSRTFLFFTFLDFSFLVYILLWFDHARLALMLRTDVVYIIGLLCECLLNILVACWFRRNWGWLRVRIEWNRRRDNRSFLVAILGGTISTLEPIINFKLITSVFEGWLQPLAVFFEFYHTVVGVTTTSAFLIVIDKAILALVNELRKVFYKYARSADDSRPLISNEFFRLLEDANDHLHPVITVFHIFTLSFSVCITGFRIVVLDREKPGIAFLVIATTINRIGHGFSLYHCGEQVQRRLIRFRRLLLREGTTLRTLDGNRASEELLNQVHLRTEHSLSLRVFNLPLCLATGLWYMSFCSTVVLVTIQFAVVICESDGISC